MKHLARVVTAPLARRSTSVTPHTPVEDLPDLCDVPDTAGKLGCSEGVVREMARKGQLEAVRLGRLVRIRRSSIARLVNGESK